MGKLIDGRWHDVWYDTQATGGKFEREDAGFRNWITVDGEPGPGAHRGGYAAAAGRYHLYVSLACPWAHRALIMRRLKGLEDSISVSVVNPWMGPEGWTFDPGRGVVPDSVNGVRCLHELYTLAKPDYTGRVTVPVLWDTQTQTIVSNESAEIIRMLNSAFDKVGASGPDYYPAELRDAINSVNDFVYARVNNGVYRAGFATAQEAYDTAVHELFGALDNLDERLAQQRFLAGKTLTEADWRLFTTLVRFDSVYHGHFKCNLRRIQDYAHLWPYLRELYQQPGIADTVDLISVKQHYYRSHPQINPTAIVPAGPEIDFTVPHGRG